MKSKLEEYMDHPEKYLKEQVDRYFLEKYDCLCYESPEQERKLDQMLNGAKVKRQMRWGHESRLKKKDEECKRFHEAYEQHRIVQKAVDPAEMRIIKERLALLWEDVHDGALVNEKTIEKNEKERSRYAAFDTLPPKKREAALKEFQGACIPRHIRLSEVCGNVPFDEIICNENPPAMCEVPVREKGKFRMARVLSRRLWLCETEVAVT